MNREQWLASDDPLAMLGVLYGEWDKGGEHCLVSERKMRLWSCACVRSIWRLVGGGRWLLPVEVAERFADGAASEAEIDEAWSEQEWWREEFANILTKPYSSASATFTVMWMSDSGRSAEAAQLLRDTVGDPFVPFSSPSDKSCVVCGGSGRFILGSGEDAEAVPCRCFPWRTPDVVAVARSAYDARLGGGELDPLALSALADALEEAGCPAEVKQMVKAGDDCLECGRRTRQAGEGYRADARYCDWCRRTWISGDHYILPKANPLLSHLRSPEPHFRGMWGLDLVLGRS